MPKCRPIVIVSESPFWIGLVTGVILTLLLIRMIR